MNIIKKLAYKTYKFIKGRKSMKAEDAIKEGLKLIKDSKIAMVGSIGDNSYPNVKAMLNLETAGLKRAWFSTNTSSKRVAQFKNNSKACVYFVEENSFRGLMLVGEIQVLDDAESKQRLWREGFEMYYPLGVTDPDYSVLSFTAKWGNYYHGLDNVTFDV